jgi:hypothetical protein
MVDIYAPSPIFRMPFTCAKLSAYNTPAVIFPEVLILSVPGFSRFVVAMKCCTASPTLKLSVGAGVCTPLATVMYVSSAYTPVTVPLFVGALQ